MSTTTTRSLLAALTFAASGLSSAPAGAVTIQFVSPIDPSFWSQPNWSPFPFVPQDDATVVLDNSHPVAPVLHLGDASGIPAQAADLAQLRLQSGDFIVDWASEAPGGTSGSLNFTGTDHNDLGVGIRVGGTGDRAVLALIGANTDPAMASNVVIGPGVDPSAPAGLLLRGPNPGLPGQTGTFHAASVSLLGDLSTLEVSGNQQVTANRLEIGSFGSATVGSRVDVLNGAHVAVGRLELLGDVGDAVGVDGAILDGTLVANSVGGGARVAYANGARGTVSLEAQSGATLDVSAVGAGTNLTVSGATAQGGSRVQLNAASGAVVGLADFARLEGVAVTSDAATVDVLGEVDLVRSSIDLANQSKLDGVSDLDLDQSSLRIAGGSRGAAFRLVLRPSTSSAVLDQAGTATTFGWVSVALGVGSNLTLSRSAGHTIVFGGDMSGPGTASFDLRSGSTARVVSLGRTSFGTLSIGSSGSLTLDPTSALAVGEISTTPLTSGRITLGSDGQLWGSGTINGVSFLAGTHLDVLNVGGVLHPGFSPGRLTIGGSYTQQSGVLELSIGGATPATGFSQLLASDGIAISGGTIRFVRDAGYQGDLGATLQFLLSPNGVVTVAPGVAIDDQTGLGLAFDFATGVGTITRVITPEPPIAALLAAGCVGLGWIGRRRRA